jgi:hypothetical protein
MWNFTFNLKVDSSILNFLIWNKNVSGLSLNLKVEIWNLKNIIWVWNLNSEKWYFNSENLY